MRNARRGPTSLALHRLILCGSLAFCLSLVCLDPVSAQGAPPQAPASAKPAAAGTDAATRQYAAAVALQNRELYELAADEWSKFLDKYPADSRASRARHYRGVCHLKDKRYEPAIADFSEVIKTDPKFNLLAATYLNLGLAQYSLAQAGNKELYPPAAESFAELVTKFLKSEYAAQASFYRGEALYAAGNKAEAARAYDDFVRKYPRNPLLPDALYALGVAQEELGDHAEADKTFASFLEGFPRHRLAGEVNLRSGEALLATGKFAEAEQRFAEAAATPGFALADSALMRLAAAQFEQKKFREAAATYQSVPEKFPASKQKTPAQLSAGKSLFLAGDFAAAREALKAIAPESAESLEAAHWMSQSWLKERQPTEALAAAESGLASAGEAPGRVSLEMDRAEALALIPERRGEALEAYTALATAHPDDPLAPQALYLAAFTALESGKFQEAVTAADAFRKHYATHALLPDVLAIHAEGELQLGHLPEAQKLYDGLLSSYAKHPDAAAWRLRSAWSRYLQKQYRETIDQLEPQLAALPAGAAQAEAQFLIGSSALELQEFPRAATALAAAAKADPSWPQADEVLLAWAQAERMQSKFAEAREHLDVLIKDFPQSKLLDRVHYRLGELAYVQQDYETAAAEYGKVLAGWLNSPVLPASRLGLGFSELNRGQPEEAAQAFSQLIENAPQHELALRARYGRALARHRLKQYTASIDDLQAVLAAGKTPERGDAQYLLGLCFAAESKPADAVAVWRELLGEQPEYAGADRARYELAWALKAENKPDEAAAFFAELVKQHPNSPLAAESSYQVGEAAYAQGDWAAAASAYQNALERAKADGPKSPVGEQAAHKLAWTYYKQEALDRALEEFIKQRQTWPEGPLAEDAGFMQGEILFKQSKFAEAGKAYEALKQPSNPEFLTLALLHSGQALGKLNQWDESLKVLNRCLEQAPESPLAAEALCEKAWAQQNLGQVDEALATYEAVTAKTDREVAARSRFQIGEIFAGKQDYKEAVRNFFKVAYSYGYPEWQSRAHYQAGRCLEELGKPEHAKKSYEELIKEFPDSESAAAAKERLAALEQSKS